MRIKSYKTRSTNMRSFFVFLLLALGLATAILLVKNNQDLRGIAANDGPRIILAPNEGQLPLDVKVYIDPGKNNDVVFAQVKIRFPKNQLTYKGGQISGGAFKNTVFVSTEAQVNGATGNNGDIVLIAGVHPDDHPVTQTAELGTITFDKSTPDVMPTVDNVTIVTSDSQIVALPNKSFTNPSGFGSRLFSQNPRGINATKVRNANDLGLTLAVKQRADGKDFIQASWPNIDSIDRPNFLRFGTSIRKEGVGNAVDKESDKGLTADDCGSSCTKNYENVSTLPPGEYYVHLRAIFKQKVVPQEPHKAFVIRGNGRIILK